MNQSRPVIVIIYLTFFVISFLTNILGPIIPDIISGFHLSLTMAAVLPFSFFIAYGFLSIPAGFLVERFGEKPTMTGAFFLAGAGALTFAILPVFAVALGSIFLIGTGMAALQVAINPLLRVAVGERHYALHSTGAQLVFGLASFLSPLVYALLLKGLSLPAHAQSFLILVLARATPAHLPWVSIYWIFAAGSFAMMTVLAMMPMPAVHRSKDETAGTWDHYRVLLGRKRTWLYFFCIVAYVGSEQGTADWMSEYLARYHGMDPHAQSHQAAPAPGVVAALHQPGQGPHQQGGTRHTQ